MNEINNWMELTYNTCVVGAVTMAIALLAVIPGFFPFKYTLLLSTAWSAILYLVLITVLNKKIIQYKVFDSNIYVPILDVVVGVVLIGIQVVMSMNL